RGGPDRGAAQDRRAPRSRDRPRRARAILGEPGLDQRLPYSTLFNSEESASPLRSMSGREFCCTAAVMMNTAIAPRTAPATALAAPGTANFIGALQYFAEGRYSRPT